MATATTRIADRRFLLCPLILHAILARRITFLKASLGETIVLEQTGSQPTDLNSTRKYYYLSRFMFAWYLIAFFFAHIALFTGFLALFSRLGGYLSALTTFVATFFQVLGAALMT